MNPFYTSRVACVYLRMRRRFDWIGSDLISISSWDSFEHANVVFWGDTINILSIENHYNRLKLSILNCLIIVIEHHHHHHRWAHPVKVAFITFETHSNGFDWIGPHRFWIHGNNNKNSATTTAEKVKPHKHARSQHRRWSDRFNVKFFGFK